MPNYLSPLWVKSSIVVTAPWLLRLHTLTILVPKPVIIRYFVFFNIYEHDIQHFNIQLGWCMWSICSSNRKVLWSSNASIWHKQRKENEHVICDFKTSHAGTFKSIWFLCPDDINQHPSLYILGCFWRSLLSYDVETIGSEKVHFIFSFLAFMPIPYTNYFAYLAFMPISHTIYIALWTSISIS